MANELTISASLSYTDANSSIESAYDGVLATVAAAATSPYAKHKQVVGTSEEPMILGDFTSPGFVIIKNLDATNYVEIKTGTGGIVMGKMKAGEPWMGRLGSGAQAPYLIANSGSCVVEITVFNT